MCNSSVPAREKRTGLECVAGRFVWTIGPSLELIMGAVSDTDGLAIRGKGTSASVWGQSTANFRGQTSTNAYAAAASWANAPSSAHGANLSVAGTVKVYYNQVNGLSVSAKLGVAGGFSTASAH